MHEFKSQEIAQTLSESPAFRQAVSGTLTAAEICSVDTPPLDSKPTDSRPHIRDRTTGKWHLLDSGAVTSVCPRSAFPHAKRDPRPLLKAVNGSYIATFGVAIVDINLGALRFKHPMVIADVSRSILGWDFIGGHSLSLVPSNRTYYLVGNRGRKVAMLTKPVARSLLNIQAVDTAAVADSYQKYAQKQTVMDGKCGVKVDIPPVYAALLAEFPGIDEPDFSRKPLVTHTIETKGRPSKAVPRPIGKSGTWKHDEGRKAWEGLAKLNVISRLQPHEVPYWTSALHLQLKADGSLRPCGDYRKLNDATELDGFPLPNIRSFASKLRGAKVFAKVDLTKAYYNVGLDYASSMKTVVTTPWGCWRFNRLSMGLKNSAQTFQRLIDSVCHDLDVFAYIDDILVYGRDEGELQAKLRTLLGRLKEAGLAINRGKCIFGVRELEFLGYWVTPSGLAPLPRKTKAIVDFPPPKTAKGLLGFLGAINYYRRCLPVVNGKSPAEILQPLYQAATDKTPGKKFVDRWAELGLDDDYAAAKDLLVTATELSHPDPAAPLALTTDASLYGIGGVLEQWTNGRWEPLGWFSKHLKPAQQKWNTFKRELWGIFQGLRHFIDDIVGRPDLVIYTDHLPIAQAMKSQKLPEHDPPSLRQLLEIANWTQDIRHVPGVDNEASDWMSRRPDYEARSADTPLGLEYQLPVAALHTLKQATCFNPDELAACTAALGLTEDSIIDVIDCAAVERGTNGGSTEDEVGAIEVAAAEDLLNPHTLATEQAKCPETLDFSRSKAAQLVKVGEHDIWCKKGLPFVPTSLRKMLYDTFHSLNHPGPDTTAKKLSGKYYWDGMTKQVKGWAGQCVTCQKSKAQRTINPPMDNRPVDYPKFQDVQIDVVGPLPESCGFKYLLTVICRSTNWFVAAPMTAATAEACAMAFNLHWYARHGCPTKATCDNASTFTGGCWTTLQKARGIRVEFTPPYHAQSLGSVERQHRDLKVGLRARLLDSGGGNDWFHHLPDVLLGRATAYQKRLRTSSAMVVYGVPLQVPGDLLRPTAEGTELDVQAVVDRMQTAAAQTPPPTTDFHYDVHFPESAARATAVFVKTVKSGLGPLKSGPYPIVKREGKSALVLDYGKDAGGQARHKVQHWANCQPANLADDAELATAPRRGRKPMGPKRPRQGRPVSSPATSTSPPPAPPQPKSLSPARAQAEVRKSRSGRTIKSTKRQDFNYG